MPQHAFVGNDLKAFEDGIEDLPNYVYTSDSKAFDNGIEDLPNYISTSDLKAALKGKVVVEDGTEENPVALNDSEVTKGIDVKLKKKDQYFIQDSQDSWATSFL